MKTFIKNNIRLLAAVGALALLAGMSLLIHPNRNGGVEFGLNSGLPKARASISRSGFLLNTFVSVTIYDSDDTTILDHSMALCKEYEQVFSRTLPESELYKINHRPEDQQTLTVSDDMAELLEKGLEYCRLSGGAFDITIEPVSSLWDFTAQEPSVPDSALLAAQAEKVGYENLVLEGNSLTFLSPDTRIDLGAIAKGFIADQIKDYLTGEGIESAVINLGGNVLCIGSLPDGSPFQVGLQKPFAKRQETIEILNISDCSVVSSGVYERHFEKNGINYHHLLNPADGMPYNNGLISVTVLSRRSVDGDGLSTTLFSLGLEEGMKLAGSLDQVSACFIDEDYHIYYSGNMEEFINQEARRIP